MNFLYPGFLYALVAVLIPVIIHLFNFRRFKKVYFSNVRFLREVKEETQSRSRLRHLLVLLTRVLAITFLVLAFAQPYIPLDDQRSVSGNQAVSIYLDNSFSMDGLNTDGRLFDIGKQYAYEIARSYEQTDVFQLLTNDFEGRHQRLVNREDLAGLVDEAVISPSVKSLSEVIARQKQALAAVEADRKTLFLISDFQRQNSDLDALVNDTNYNIRLIPITPTTTSNLYIDSCWFESPVRQLNVPQELGIRVRNSSDKVVENVPVKLTVNGQQKALASFSVAPNSYTDTMLVFTTANPGIQQGRVSITDHPVTFDDHFYFSYAIAPLLKVMVVDDATDTNNP
ncbi:MAG: BatA domain-containing protein, partial [Bacteroidota bacterium]